MFILHVQITVKPECREEFLKEITTFAKACTEEPGCVRFDVIQELDNPLKFMILEGFKDDDGMRAHQQCAHYKHWCEISPSFIAEPRVRTRYTNVFPGDNQ